MLFKVIALSSFLLLFVNAYSEEIYKWTDEKGQTHYGDGVPNKQKFKAKSVELNYDSITESQRKEAQARVEKEKAKAADLQNQRVKNDASAIAVIGSVGNVQPINSKVPCEEDWKKYDESTACFEQYRVFSGGVRAEAFKNCPLLKVPECVREKKTPYVGSK